MPTIVATTVVTFDTIDVAGARDDVLHAADVVRRCGTGPRRSASG